MREGVVIQASGTKTATGTGSAVTSKPARNAVFQLDVTAGGTDAGDTLDVAVETTIDGTNWFPIVAFTQVIGTAAAKRHIAKVSNDLTQAMFEAAATLAAGSVRNILGQQYRARWTIVNTSTVDVTFTFSVTALLED